MLGGGLRIILRHGVKWSVTFRRAYMIKLNGYRLDIWNSEIWVVDTGLGWRFSEGLG